MKNGCILHGGVGSGKSRTALAYYFKLCGGDIDTENYSPMDQKKILDLYIITTARKRDTLEWESEMVPFLMYPYDENGYYQLNVTIDSWNNIKRYKNIVGAFYIFDEDKVTGYGVWVKSFLQIAKHNKWIILSATPGDKWEDYIPVFIANGFYRNKTDFCNQHVIWSRYTTYPKVEGYMNTGILQKHKRDILIEMPDQRKTTQHHVDIFTEFDKVSYAEAQRNRWNPFTNLPIANVSEFCQVLRKIINTDESKQRAVLELFEAHPKVIIFYNFNYERDILRSLCWGEGVSIAEWNGEKHEPIPQMDRWVYLVQYLAGAEGWNCVKTDTMIFFSDNYSYKIMTQAAGRIDRMNTPFTDLYFYHLKTRSSIDLSISTSLKRKKKFNENKFAGGDTGWFAQTVEQKTKTKS